MHLPRLAALLAAGEARRLGGGKPLRRLMGRPLAYYPVSVLHLLGATEFIVVTRRGLAEGLRRLVEEVAGPGSATLVINEEPWRENGYSFLLAAEAAWGEHMWVTMSDHVYTPLHAARVGEAHPGAGYTVGCDGEPCCVDVAEATRAKTLGGLVEEIGKRVEPWSCVDTGLHAATPGEWLHVAAALAEENQGVIRLNGLLDAAAKRLRLIHAAPVDGLPWLEIDTPRDLEEAERGSRSWVVKNVLRWLHG